MRSTNSTLDGILEKKNLQEGFARLTKNRNNTHCRFREDLYLPLRKPDSCCPSF